MKKYFTHPVLISLVVAVVFVSSSLFPTAIVRAQTMTVSQFIELLITIGVIAPDKVVAARSAISTLSQVSTTTTSSTLASASTASSTKYIQVLSPNGGERWEIDLDLPYTITWGATGITEANVALVSTKGAVCNLSQTPVSSKRANNTFSILLKTAKCYDLVTGSSTALADGTYKIRVYTTDISGKKIVDESNTTFKILPVSIPSIKVTYPNGGETLTRNTDYDVKYTVKNVTNVEGNLVYLYLLDSNGNIAFNSHKTLRSDRTYNLELPSSLSAGAYKVKLKTTTATDHVEIEDISDNFFWISTGL